MIWILLYRMHSTNAQEKGYCHSSLPSPAKPQLEKPKSWNSSKRNSNLSGLQVTSIELDNFLTDRDYREEKGIFTQGKQAFHFDLMQQALIDIRAGKQISIPRYDFVAATSSHDLQGQSQARWQTTRSGTGRHHLY